MPSAEHDIRLNKYISQCGLASRRKADELIAAGHVRVNGTLAEPGQKIDPARDRITVHGKTVRPRREQTTIMLNKPIRVVTTLNDPEQRTTVQDILPPKFREARLVPVGRLDFFSEGLLLLTTDGELCNRLTHPRHHLPKHYDVLIRGEVPAKILETMRKGMQLAEGEELAPVRVKAVSQKSGDTLLQMQLIQGINRQIRRMCRDTGLTILKLRRVGQGPIHLGSLKSGQARELTPQELIKLRQAVNL